MSRDRRFALIAVLTFVSSSVATEIAAAGVDAVLPPSDQYMVMAKRYLFAQPNASASASLISDQEVQALGGKVDSRFDDRIIVSLPPQVVEVVRHHPGVKYLRRVVKGDQPVITPATSTRVTSSLRMTTTGLKQTSQAIWSSGVYQYDGSGNIINIGPHAFVYDGSSRLTQARMGANTEIYTYDPFGNMTNRRTNDVDWPVAIDPATNRRVGYNYDAAGNLTGVGSQTYAYDPFSMMREKHYGSPYVDVYVYTADDERIGMRIGARWLWSFRDLSGKVIRQYESVDGAFSYAWRWVEDYVYRDGLLLGGERVPEEGGRRHFHLDHLGTPRLITNDLGYTLSRHDYFPFGNEMTPLIQEIAAGFDREEPMKFTGHERDITTFSPENNTNYSDYMHARHADPNSGRFLSVDPVLDIKEALHEPQMWNRYAYVTNNPLKFTDPDGRYRTFYQEKPMTAENLAMDENTPAVVKGAFYTQGALLGLGAGGVAPSLLRSGLAWYRAATFTPAVETTGVTLTLTQAKRIGTINEIVHNWNARRTLQATGAVLVQHQQKLRDGVAGLQRAATSLQASLNNPNLDPAARAVMEKALKYAQQYMQAAQELLEKLK